MRPSLPQVAVALVLAGLALAPARGKDEKPPLSPGNNVPGPFHPYNVNGPRAGFYHSLVTAYGLEPVVLVFSRDPAGGAALKSLLTQLDGAIAKNPAVRLHAFVVFLSDDLTNVVEDDARRAALADKVKELAQGLKLEHVVLALADKASLEKYALDPASAVTVVLYRKLRIEAVHALAQDKFTDATVKQILGEVAEKLGAAKK